VQGRFVIYGDLFPRFDVSQGDEENVAVMYLHERIGLTAVINVMGPIPTLAPIQAASIIDSTDT